MNSKTFFAALTATTFLASGVALAANQPQGSAETHQGQTAVNKDFRKLSVDGSRAFQNLTLARLAIFNGRIDAAKKELASADSGFAKAQNDDTAFMKAETDLKPAATAPKSDSQAQKTADATPTQSGSAQTDTTQAKTPIAWLPVDGMVAINEDYSLNPAKKAAVADANKSLKSGDKAGAMQKLKLADVDVDYTLGVVPLKQTLNDVHQAASLMEQGEYYQASQVLRKVQQAERFDVADVSGMPKAAQAGNVSSSSTTSGSHNADTAKPNKS